MAKRTIFPKKEDSEKITVEHAEAVVEEIVDSSPEELVAAFSAPTPPVKLVPKSALAKSEYDMVEVEIPVHIKIAGQFLQPGRHTLPRHQARDVIAIASKKMRADLQALAVSSKSYLVNKALNGSINVKEVDKIEVKQ